MLHLVSVTWCDFVTEWFNSFVSLRTFTVVITGILREFFSDGFFATGLFSFVFLRSDFFSWGLLLGFSGVSSLGLLLTLPLPLSFLASLLSRCFFFFNFSLFSTSLFSRSRGDSSLLFLLIIIIVIIIAIILLSRCFG